MDELIIKDENGLPKFIGQEDPHNPQVSPKKGSKMICQVCKGEFDFLLGQDTPDGGRMGCQKDYLPSSNGVVYESNEDAGLI